MLLQLYNILLSLHGPQGWWPINGQYTGQKNLGEQDKVEICIGAILTQNTTWKNVEHALKALRENDALSLPSINNASLEALAKLIRSSGYHNQKARKLQVFASHILQNHQTCSAFLNQHPNILRPELLSLWGIGPETADSIILYAAQQPVFVIDTYTRRIIEGLGWIAPNSSYEALQKFFMSQLPSNTSLFNEFHALIVQHAKECCVKTNLLGKDCSIAKTFIS